MGAFQHQIIKSYAVIEKQKYDILLTQVTVIQQRQI